jgi:phosphocarrier protein HPr
MNQPASPQPLTELREVITIVNQRGLHARASAKFVNAVAKLPEGLDIRLAKDGTDAAGGSILGLMMLGAAKGDAVELIVSGEDGEAQDALLKLAGLIKDGFGED